MYTHTIIPAILAFALTLGVAHAFQSIDKQTPSGTATLDAKSSTIQWRGSKVTGKHNGTIAFRSGNLTMTNGALSGGRFEVDMRSIENLDIENEATRNKLVNHLKSDDFFSVEKFPVAIFTITTAKPINGAKQGEANYSITGDMKMKGITKKVSFPATIHMHGTMVHAQATVTLDRSKWDVKYGSGSFFDNLGDNMIHDDFTLELDVKATM